MKILMIGPFPPGVNGVTISNDFLYRWLISKGEKVSYINTETGLIASRQGDKISLLKIITFLSIYQNIFRVFGKDMLYMTPGQTFWGIVKYAPFICYCWIARIPYVLHIHGGYLSKSYLSMSKRKQRIVNALISKSHCVIALSESLAADIKREFKNVKVEVVENFYDQALIQPTLKRDEYTIPHFLFLSNLMLGKGILEFLDALIIIQDVHKLDFKVALAGNIEKGMNEQIQKRVKQLGDKVYFFGLAGFTKKKELLYWSDIFVLPTHYIMEGQPLSIIEAYVTGNIVVSTHQGGIKDISNYDTFFYTKGQDTLDLVNVLLRVVSQLKNINCASSMQKSKERFAPELFLSKIEGLLLKNS